MSELILHHYPASPFAEKIRLIFGFKQLSWQSVTIPVIMPKPDLTALTGGYRRTPVLQIGADIYCDTALIAEVLDQIGPGPSLFPPALAGQARLLAQWADTTLFWSVIPYLFQPAGVAELFAGMPPEAAKAFARDRAAMRAGSSGGIGHEEATASLKLYLQRLEQMLQQSGAFLLGEVATIADFSVYHPIWFIKRIKALAGILQDSPALLAWHARMHALGHGKQSELSAATALEVATRSTPQANASAGHALLGQTVQVTPSDYAMDSVEGELVAVQDDRVGLKRIDQRVGEVVVHFPRIGFRMERPSPPTPSNP
jgi:glutathione S-transferase